MTRTKTLSSLTILTNIPSPSETKKTYLIKQQNTRGHHLVLPKRHWQLANRTNKVNGVTIQEME